MLGPDVPFTGSRNIRIDTSTTRTISLTNAAGTADVVNGGADNDTIELDEGGATGFIADYQAAPSFVSRVERFLRHRRRRI